MEGAGKIQIYTWMHWVIVVGPSQAPYIWSINLVKYTRNWSSLMKLTTGFQTQILNVCSIYQHLGSLEGKSGKYTRPIECLGKGFSPTLFGMNPVSPNISGTI